MFTTLAMCLAVAGRVGINPPAPQGQRFQVFPWRDIEDSRRQQLDLARSRGVFMEENIEMFEQALKLPWRRLSPEKAALERRYLDKCRMDLEFHKQYERELELWGEQRKLNPGSETDQKAIDRILKMLEEQSAWREAWEAGRIAPPPREKK